MSALVHFEVEILGDVLVVPLCENQAGRDPFTNPDDEVEMTPIDAEVTCPACLSALGYAVPDEQLIECRGDPLPKARAA